MDQKLHTQALAVYCHGITFGYCTGKPVLSNLAMSVPQGSIYSLLGASSSGKTTLIKIITGSLKASTGEVKIFGQTFGSKESLVPGIGVGYMPQDLCLYPKFSIETTLLYFGRINQMQTAQINERIRFLREYLDLPEPNRPISDLSGGQQRRVSLAVALIHSPALMILDEPTVGIDPVLRSRIWSFLQQLREQGHTIFLTTHYIEETVASDLIAYMRNGELICEQSPLKLMSRYSTCHLEDALYDLCRKQDMERKTTDPVVKSDKPKKCMAKFAFRQDGLQLNTLAAVAKRTWHLLACDWFHLFLMLIYPSVVLAMMSLSFYKLPTVQIEVSNQGSTQYGNLSFAHQLVNSITGHIRAHESNSDDQIVSMIENGTSVAGLSFGSHECFEERIKGGILASDEVLQCAKISVYLNTSHFVHLWLVVLSLANSFKQALNTYLAPMKINPRAFLPAIDFFQAANGKEIEMKFVMESFFVTGQISGLNFMLTFLMSGLVWLKDREHGIFQRSQVHKVSQLYFFLSHLLVQAALMLLSNGFFLLMAVCLFGLPVTANLLAAYALLYLQTVSTTLLGLLLAITSSCHMTYLTKFSLLVFPCFFISGVMWPLESINIRLVHMLTSILPLTKPTTAMRAILSRNLPPSNPLVYGGFLTLTCYTVVGLVACLLRLHMKH